MTILKKKLQTDHRHHIHGKNGITHDGIFRLS